MSPSCIRCPSLCRSWFILSQRLRRWPNIKPTSAQRHCPGRPQQTFNTEKNVCHDPSTRAGSSAKRDTRDSRAATRIARPVTQPRSRNSYGEQASGPAGERASRTGCVFVGRISFECVSVQGGCRSHLVMTPPPTHVIITYTPTPTQGWHCRVCALTLTQRQGLPDSGHWHWHWRSDRVDWKTLSTDI